MARIVLLVALLCAAIACDLTPTPASGTDTLPPAPTDTPAPAPTDTPPPAPTATPTPLAPLLVQAADLLQAYKLNKFQADVQVQVSDNGGRWLRVTGYVTEIVHEHFTLAGGEPTEFSLFDLGMDDITCKYANDDVRLSPALLNDQWVSVTARGDGERLLGGVDLIECHDVSGQARSEILGSATAIPSPEEGSGSVAPEQTPLDATWTGSGQAVVLFDADAGQYLATVSVSNNQDCSPGVCVDELFTVLLQDARYEGATEALAFEIAAEWQGVSTFIVGGTLGLPAGEMVVAIDAVGDWSLTIAKQ